MPSWRDTPHRQESCFCPGPLQGLHGNSGWELHLCHQLRDGVVKMYDGKFSFVNSFTDPGLPDAGTLVSLLRNSNIMASCIRLCRARTRSDTTTSRVRQRFIDVFDLMELLRVCQGGRSTPLGLALARDNSEVLPRLLVGKFRRRSHHSSNSRATLPRQLRGRKGDPSPLTAFGG